MQKRHSSDCHLPDSATDKNRAGWLAVRGISSNEPGFIGLSCLLYSPQLPLAYTPITF